MNWLAGIAPTIFEALTGNIPGAAISAAAFIAKQLGWSNSGVEAVKQQLNALTPEQQLKFEQLDIEFAKIETKRLYAEYGDNANARDRQVNLAKAGMKDWTNSILAVQVMLAFFVMCGLMILAPKVNNQTSWAILQMLYGCAVLVLGYYFGSSKSSALKNDIIQSQIKSR